MRCYEVFSHSVPFPKEGFQKYDVVTPTDRKEYGTKYVVTDYIEVTHDPTKPCPYYQYEIREYSFVGYKQYKNPIPSIINKRNIESSCTIMIYPILFLQS